MYHNHNWGGFTLVQCIRTKKSGGLKPPQPLLVYAHGLVDWVVIDSWNTVHSILGAPATFQRLMDTLLAGCRNHTRAYMDDVAI
jgi:hypothetical protein